MKRLWSILFVCLSASVVQAQNLIPNPGFEDNNGMPSTTGEWSLVEDWQNAGSAVASPDYFHNNGTLGGDLPETPIGDIYAFDGDAVMGFAATGEKGTDFREYLSVQLIQPLNVGANYKLQFRITNGSVSDFSNAGLATSNFGIYLSAAMPVQTGNDPLGVSPTRCIPEVLYSPQWKVLTFYVEADQAYEYLTLGVFGDDADKDIDDMRGGGSTLAYYFLDGFKMEEVDPSVVPELETDDMNDKREAELEEEPNDVLEDFYIPNAFSPDNDGVNDIFFPTSNKGYQFQMKIFNKWGELVYEMNEGDAGWDGRNVRRNRTDELYVWQLVYEKVDENHVLVEKILEGNVTVIR